MIECIDLDEPVPEFTLQQALQLLRQFKERKQNNMAIKINVSQEDVARTRLISEAGWYPCLVKDVKQERNKAGDADNIVVDYEVIEHPTETGVRARTWFSEKAMGMIIPFLKDGFGIEVPNTGIADFDVEVAKGRKVMCFLQVENNQGKDNNNVKGYRQYGK